MNNSEAMQSATAARPLELLAPAGDGGALEAALDAGADAVYFGLTALNARRRARNFRQVQFAQAVQRIHARGARAYLTLNIDLAEREVGLAARILELARECCVDAVLVRDPALLALRPEFPEIEFHFSTQTCVANSVDVAAARELGAARVVLAREMTLAEIAAASAVPGVQTEVFVQGALCFCVSGRCLLSSWVGGRSGNRGACTSPCRVPWSADGEPGRTPLSMRDLATLHRLDDLRRSGVTALKIEGRLKTADWVRRAVSLYRRALGGENAAGLLEEVVQLGAYTGRSFTCGYLDGQREELTGLAGREASSRPASASEEAGPVESDDAEPGYGLEILVTDRAIECRCECAGHEVRWSMPKTVVRRPHRAVAVGNLLAHLADVPVQGHRLTEPSTNDPAYLLMPRVSNAVIDRVSAVIRQAQKSPGEQIHVELRPAVRQRLEKTEPSADNRLTLGQQPDRVRLEPGAVKRFVQAVRPKEVVVEGLSADGLERVLSAAAGARVVAALPQVFFEYEIAAVRELIHRCGQAEVSVEVNSWGGWQLAREAGVVMESGPGLPVLNSLAARLLADRGVRCVTLSLEADRKQWEEAAAACPVPCSLVVFGRPALMISRAKLSQELLGTVLADRRGMQMTAQIERGLCVFRPAEPFDLRGWHNEKLRVAHLVVDLAGSPDPLADWHNAPMEGERRFAFNYDRTLA